MAAVVVIFTGVAVEAATLVLAGVRWHQHEGMVVTNDDYIVVMVMVGCSGG